MQVRARSYRNVESILKGGVDRLPLSSGEVPAQLNLPVHENVRGGDYYN